MSGTSSPALLLLNALLQGEGTRYGVFIKNKAVQQAAFTDNETLVQALRSASLGGWDAYHACALFGPAGGRTALAATSCRALWLDVDAGDGKAIGSSDDALGRVAAFVKSSGLPTPTLVSSGYGWHAYWFLNEALDPQTWKRYAEGLKALTPWADQSRTADIASILRTPETWNYKRGGKAPVILGPMRGPYGLDRFEHLLAGGSAHLGHRADLPRAGSRKQTGRLGPIAAAAARIYGDDQVDAHNVADGCAQLSAMRDTGGLVSEPIWKACIGVLAFCNDGEELAHEWSTGDDRYNPAETQGKYDRSVALGAPTTCKHFAGINPAGCGGCPHSGRISTPVQLGRGVQKSVAEGQETGSAVRPEPGAHPSVSAPQLNPLPHGYRRRPDGGIDIVSAGPGGGDLPVKLSTYPVELKTVTRGEMKKDAVTYVIRHLIPSEGFQDIEIAGSSLFSANGGAILAGRGIAVENADGFKKFMRDSYNLLIAKQKLGSMYEQCGWKENDTAFLVGHRMYRSDGTVDEVPGTSELHFRGQQFGPRAGGSLDAWKDKVDKLFGIGREASTFAMLSGFAAPLIRFLSTTEGGAVVSVVSRKSGEGKSVGVDGATSIWGDGEAMRLINGDTQVARAITWGVLGNLPCVLDDIAMRDAEQTRDFIQRFTDGRDKLRGTREGELRHLLASWQTILITASNTSLVDAISSIGGTAAMAYRILEFQASLPAGVNKRDGEQWRRDLLVNWGYAGDAYLKYLLQPETVKWAKEAVRAKQQQLIEEHAFSTEHRFWTRTLACVDVAHRMALKLELVRFPVEAILPWAIDATKLMGGVGRPAGGFDRRDTAVDILAAFVGDHIDYAVVLPRRPVAGQNVVPLKEPRGKCYMRIEVAEDRLYIRQDALAQYCAKRQFSITHFKAEMRDRGCLYEILDKRSLTAGTTSGVKVPSMHIIGFNMKHPDLSGVTELKEVTRPPGVQGSERKAGPARSA